MDVSCSEHPQPRGSRAMAWALTPTPGRMIAGADCGGRTGQGGRLRVFHPVLLVHMLSGSTGLRGTKPGHAGLFAVAQAQQQRQRFALLGLVAVPIVVSRLDT